MVSISVNVPGNIPKYQVKASQVRDRCGPLRGRKNQERGRCPLPPVLEAEVVLVSCRHPGLNGPIPFRIPLLVNVKEVSAREFNRTVADAKKLACDLTAKVCAVGTADVSKPGSYYVRQGS
jgi:hypothetical protein